MTRRLDLHALEVGREGVASHRELMAAGVARSTIGHRIAPGGRWQRMHPGVVLLHRGVPTRRERLIAALTFAGDGAVVSGAAALALHGLSQLDVEHILVLVAHERRRHSHGTVVIERTRRLPAAVHRSGIPLAPLSRSVVDACRRIESVNAVRNLVSDAVQNHRLALADLAVELDAAARQRTAVSRAVLTEMGTGVRFAAEARARELVLRDGLRGAEFNVEVLDRDGRVVTIPDGYFPELACGYQIDSRRWHMSPQSYERTLRARGYAARFGIILLSVTPSRVFDDPDGFLADLRGTLETARSREVPRLTWRVRADR
jgi:hypothetical protein